MLELLNETPLWNYLSETEKPIVLYGMGDGADMIISILEEKGIAYSEIFASDEFVRGHFFHGKKVLKLSEVEEKYSDFIILMTFAVHDRPTLDKIKAMSEKYEFYSPCVSIIGKEYFTEAFLLEHEEEFRKAYELLADEKSKETFLNVLRYKLSGKVKYLYECEYEKEKLYEDILHLNNDEVILDLGAYDGDTIREFLGITKGEYKKIIAFEPDSKNFKKLTRKTENLTDIDLYNLGAWDKEETLYFQKKAARGSRTEKDGIPVEFRSVDGTVTDKITFLKMDIEGAELKALCGAEKTIRENLPKLYVCAYHRDEDMYALPLKINELSPDYKIYYRHHPYVPAWESNFYAVTDCR